jgi:membrane protein DedA with SNARE-associated domain/uncharacterized tellurite resistance protein B-like protein
LLSWLSTLPPVAVYVVLALLAAVENIIPPVPADMAVALGAFLTHRGVTTLPMVFAVTWTSNVLGAIGVYFAARRYGRRLFATGAGRRLLAPGAIASMERGYLRFGILGIFIARLLPGIRAVVAPFAGLANLSAPRAIIPMAVASALWYGGVSIIGATIGAEWARIQGLIVAINRTLGAVGIAAVVIAGLVLLLRRRRRRRGPRGRLWGALRRAFAHTDATADAPPEEAPEPALRSAALLLLELAYADAALTPSERKEIEERVRGRWGLGGDGRPSAKAEEHPERTRWGSYREQIVERFAHERRLALIERLWHVAFAAGTSHATRDRLTRSAGELLGFSPEEADAVARRAEEMAP